MFDVLTMAAMTSELSRLVLDGRIQKLGLVDPLTVAAEVYANGRRRALVASANPDRAGIWLADRLPSTDPSLITPFGLQLRKYVRGGFLVGIEQPPMERVLRLAIAKRLTPASETDHEAHDDDVDDDPWSDGITRLELIVEVMGRHSNLILVDADGLVMESAKRVTTKMSRVRPIVPKVEYTLPPVPDKPDPRQITSPGAEVLLTGAKPAATLWDTLVKGLRGVSPQTGREIAYRLTGSSDTKVRDVSTGQSLDLARIVRSLFEPILTNAWQPQVYEQEGEPIAYAAIPMQYLAAMSEARAVESISEAIETFGDTGEVQGPRDHAQRRDRIVAAIDRERDRIGSRLHALQEQHERSSRSEQLREWGELIYGYIWQINPGDTELVIDDVRVPLDPKLSGKDNAAAYFEDYRKAQRAGANLPEHIAEAQTTLDYLAQLRVQVTQADGFAAIESIRQEFEAATGGRQSVGERPGSQSRKQQSRKVTGLTEAGGHQIFVGRSGKENDQVTFEIGGAEDTWLHARGVPGSHVIIRWARPMPDDDDTAVETAAALAAWYSGSRNATTVEVDVTRRKHVRKIKGGGPGMVTYRNEHTIAVRPQDEAALRKEGRLD